MRQQHGYAGNYFHAPSDSLILVASITTLFHIQLGSFCGLEVPCTSAAGLRSTGAVAPGASEGRAAHTGRSPRPSRAGAARRAIVRGVVFGRASRDGHGCDCDPCSPKKRALHRFHLSPRLSVIPAGNANLAAARHTTPHRRSRHQELPWTIRSVGGLGQCESTDMSVGTACCR